MLQDPFEKCPPLSWRQRLERLRGSTIEFDLRPYAATVAEIRTLGDELAGRRDATLQERSRELRAEARDAAADRLLPRAYALVRETARRVVGLHPFDVQVLAAVALHQGKVVEMQTGEGKTLAATMPAYLNVLTGRGVHVLTFNDYLARRDAEWMGPIYRFLGLRVAHVREGMTPAERRDAYRADVTYVTAKEAGFDHLRDLLATAEADLVHRPFHFALVDEADSLLIDEARVPLVLAGSVERRSSRAPRLAAAVADLADGVDFVVEENGRDVELTEAGFDRLEARLGCGSLVDEKNYGLLTELHCALHAHALLRRDVDYIVRGGRLELVDEFTGRVAEDRHWPDGLQAALEAKEGLEPRADGRVLGSMTLEHFLGGYPRLCGMTGTARAAAGELQDAYGLGVVVVPTHRPRIRRDHDDVVYTHREAKEKGLVEEIRREHATRRPVLVGTLSVEESERLARRLADAGVACDVLNAKNDAMEAEIVTRAGALGAVTISTHMAGRGVDIRLGGADEAQREAVAALGGLYVIGTGRHENRRVDLQLRGRAGRQGDPGESRYFVSLEDDLLVRFGLRRLIPARLQPARRDEPIESRVIRREIARTQRIVEGRSREIHQALWRYATPVEKQRRLLHDERQALLRGRDPGLWREHPRYGELVAAVGEEALRQAETAVVLHHFDRAWSEHLADAAALREGIHLVGLGGEDPLKCFQVRTGEAFHRRRAQIDEDVFHVLDDLVPGADGIDLDALGLRGPSATWTYAVSDDPFRHQLGRRLTGPGQTTMTIAAADMAWPLLILWALVDYWKNARTHRDEECEVDGTSGSAGGVGARRSSTTA